MKKPLLIIALFTISTNVLGKTVYCECTPKEIFAGFTGGNGKILRVDCLEGGDEKYALGNIDSDMSEVRYSTALSAFMSEKQLRIQYYEAGDTLTCEQVKGDWTWEPAGLSVRNP